MKKTVYFLLIIIISACNSISKEEYLANACDCLKGVEPTDEDLKAEVADCLRSHFTAYKRGAQYSVQQYLKEHPSATQEMAQNALIENLHEELLTSCEKYNTLHTLLEASSPIE